VQLLRLKATDVDLTAGTVTLYDPKGARQQPRAHVLPLVAEAKAILSRRLDGLAPGEPVFSTDGKHCVRVETLGSQISAIVTKMLECNPPEARESFQLRDLRRTCAAEVANQGPPKESLLRGSWHTAATKDMRTRALNTTLDVIFGKNVRDYKYGGAI